MKEGQNHAVSLVLMASATLMALLALLFWTGTVDVGEIGPSVGIILGVLACMEMGMALWLKVRAGRT